jgi:membrane protein
MIIRQGDKSNTVYYLYKGELGFYREQETGKSKLGILNSGEIFGEMAYFLNEARTATVLAESDCFLFVISPDTLEALLRDSPTLSRKIIALLCQRIYRTNSQTSVARTPEESTPLSFVPQQA